MLEDWGASHPWLPISPDIAMKTLHSVVDNHVPD